jgi:hypothetical protein
MLLATLQTFYEINSTTSLLVPDKLFRLSTLIYLFSMETSRHIEKRHASCKYALSKLRDQSRQGTSINAVHCGNPATRAGKKRSLK